MTIHLPRRSARGLCRRPVNRIAFVTVVTGALVGAMLPTLPQAAAAPVPARNAPLAGRAAAPLRAATTAAVTTAAVTAAAVGKLQPAICAEGTATAVCDLYAMAGTTTMLGSTPIPIWGFSATGAAGSASAPGPVLVVRQNDEVQITLHNQIAGENVSLALPGQRAADLHSTTGDDVTGVAAGSSRTYSFTATRAGTFLYEAGHTSNGSRQVAMGLAGALVVLASDGSAYGAQAGLPTTTYDDDAVLVLSEIDPALNANPTTFDMRNFAPRYRLINGKPFPAADPISTDQNHHVLLRYVNVGSQTHAMSVLGAVQVKTADDGHPMRYPLTLTADSIQPGQTVDTNVTMPSGPESKIAVYEAAGHLDNNGQTTADPLQLSFGGMMTFLDTNAPRPSADGVGPVSTHIAATPNPSDGLSDVTIRADLSDATTGGSPVTQAEYVVDDATTIGPGFGIPMTATFGTTDVAGATGILPATAAQCTPATGPPPVALNCLSAGKHTIFVRALDAAGNWGVVGSVIFNLPKTGPQTTAGSVTDSPANGTSDVAISATGDDSDAGGSITKAEYFLDTAGADGSGTQLTLNRIATVVSEDGVLTAARVAGMTEGLHHVLVHSYDTLKLWGPLHDIPLVVDLTGPAVTAASVGPNPSNGVVSDPSNPGNLLVSAQITDKDLGGALQSQLTDAEAFLDPSSSTPAGGTGLQLLAVDGALNSTTEAVYGLIPLSQVKPLANGDHQVYVRGRDAAGNWGPLFATKLVVDKLAPTLGALSATPNPTNGAATLTLTAPVSDLPANPISTIQAAEFWTGTVDPGVGKAATVPVSVVNGQIVATVPLGSVPAGVQTFTLRVKDSAGNWSAASSTSVTVQKANGIFSNLFEPSDYALWSSSTGGVANTTAAALPTAKETGSTRGLQVTLQGGRANAAGYLTDTTPSAENTYHARFTFNAHSLVSGTATALTVFEARTAANGQVFTLQYRVNAGTPQLRTVFARSGSAALTGAWVNLGAGTHTLQLDWTAATVGTLALLIDGASKQTVSGNNNALRVDTALLGITAGFSTNAAGTSAGVAYFDTFASARTSLP